MTVIELNNFILLFSCLTHFEVLKACFHSVFILWKLIFSPVICRKMQELKGETYDKVLEKSLGFFNPNNTNYLAIQMGLGNSNFSYMTGLR